MTTRRLIGPGTPRLLLVAAMSATLAACGGSSGDDDPVTGDGGGGFEPFEDGDFDEDGIDNTADQDYLEGDEDNDGLLNIEDPDFTVLDADGDGIPNGSDPDFTRAGFMGDYDGDGFDDNPVFTTPDADNPCGSNGAGDPDSGNEDWNDNCTVSQRGQFSTSLYTAGVQRVVWCADLGADATVASQTLDTFADGRFGANTDAAVKAYQEAKALPPPFDGIVGPMSWAALQGELTEEPVTRSPLTGDGPYFDGYGVQGTRCADQVLFYAEVERPGADAPLSARNIVVGWSLAKEADSAERVPFSIDAAVDQLD